MGYLVLLMEDDSRYAGIVSEYFTQNGIDLVWRSNRKETMKELESRKYDLALLDIMIGNDRYQGHEVCREVRELYPAMPVFLLSALDEGSEIEMGYHAGAESYITKETGAERYVSKGRAMRLLFMQVKARIDASRQISGHKTRYELHGIVLDANSQKVTNDGARVDLTPKQRGILEVLMANAGKVCSRDMIIAQVWHDVYYDVETRMVDNQISQLRKKLGEKGYEYIKTAPGKSKGGFMFEEEE